MSNLGWAWPSLAANAATVAFAVADALHFNHWLWSSRGLWSSSSDWWWQWWLLTGISNPTMWSPYNNNGRHRHELGMGTLVQSLVTGYHSRFRLAEDFPLFLCLPQMMIQNWELRLQCHDGLIFWLALLLVRTGLVLLCQFCWCCHWTTFDQTDVTFPFTN